MSLRDQVETLLPNWQSWYPSIFDAALDLGLIRARVCAPGSLLLSQRHAAIYNEAVQAFREKWSVVEPESHEAERQAEGGRRDDETMTAIDPEAFTSRVVQLAPRRKNRRR
jgi:hypothetical protein